MHSLYLVHPWKVPLLGWKILIAQQIPSSDLQNVLFQIGPLEHLLARNTIDSTPGCPQCRDFNSSAVGTRNLDPLYTISPLSLT